VDPKRSCCRRLKTRRLGYEARSLEIRYAYKMLIGRLFSCVIGKIGICPKGHLTSGIPAVTCTTYRIVSRLKQS
jgi:hypothetical protein